MREGLSICHNFGQQLACSAMVFGIEQLPVQELHATTQLLRAAAMIRNPHTGAVWPHLCTSCTMCQSSSSSALSAAPCWA